MTTIATDGKTLVCDGLSTSCGIVISETVEKYRRLDDGRIMAFCGYYHEGDAMARWLNDGGDRPEVDDDFQALIVGPDSVELVEKGGARQSVRLPTAIGSGRDLAIGAMMAGKSPLDAVEIAIARDIYSGGEITELDIAPRRSVKVVARAGSNIWKRHDA